MQSLLATLSAVIVSSSVLFFSHTIYADDHTTGLSSDQITDFCTDKPIWSAFAIQTDTCIQAATICAQKEAFHTIDPVTLSEPYYECVFEKLGITIH